MFFFFFPDSFAVLRWCHKRGWTSLSSLCLLRRQLTMEHSAGGDPDPLIALWQPWPSQREDKKNPRTLLHVARLYSHQRPTQSKTLYKSSTHTSLHPIINPLNSDVTTASVDLSPLYNNSPPHPPIYTCIDFSDRIYLFLPYGNTLYNLGQRVLLLRRFTSITLKKAF